jgi:hypothetical protein
MKGPQCPLGRAPGRQRQQAWREPVLARSTATGGARAVSDAHKVTVPRGLKFKLPNRILNPARRGSELPMEYLCDLYSVRITIEMAGGKLIFSAQSPTWRANCRCVK